jgi:hypothetical protein
LEASTLRALAWRQATKTAGGSAVSLQSMPMLAMGEHLRRCVSYFQILWAP